MLMCMEVDGWGGVKNMFGKIFMNQPVILTSKLSVRENKKSNVRIFLQNMKQLQ